MEHATGVFAAIEQSALALYIRDALLLYPIANTVHVVAVLVFFAAVAVMDLAIMGALPGAQPFTTLRRFRPVAIVALAVIVLTGAILFLADAAAMARNISFQLKMAAIVAGLINVVLFERAARGGIVSTGMRASVLFSLAVWLAVAALGRFIAYA